MNREEAKLILQACRPGGRDAEDPVFAEALALVRQDAELAAWFTEQQAFDARISGSLQEIRVPSRLKAEILARNLAEPAPAPGWWRQLFARQSPAYWALATVILMFLGLAFYSRYAGPAVSFAGFSAQMVNAAMQDQHHVDQHGSDLKAALAWLGSNRGENNLTLPHGLDGGKGLTGCRVLAWHGQTVSMLCFRTEGGGHVDLFVTAAAMFPDAPPLDQPAFAVTDGSPTASWTHDGEAYLAVSHSDETILKNLWSSESIGRIQPRLLRQFSFLESSPNRTQSAEDLPERSL